MNAVLVGLLCVGATADRLTPRPIQIDLRVTQTDPTASRSEQKITVLAEPGVVTTTGRPAIFRVGGQQLVWRFGARGTGPGPMWEEFTIEVETLITRSPSGEWRLEMRVVGHPPKPQFQAFNPKIEHKWSAGAVIRPGVVSRFRPTIEVGEGATSIEVMGSEPGLPR